MYSPITIVLIIHLPKIVFGICLKRIFKVKLIRNSNEKELIEKIFNTCIS